MDNKDIMKQLRAAGENLANASFGMRKEEPQQDNAHSFAKYRIQIAELNNKILDQEELIQRLKKQNAALEAKNEMLQELLKSK